MKNYEKRYEDVFTAKHRLKKCNINKVGNDIGMDTAQYIGLVRENVVKFEKDIFDNLVKVFWLLRRFCYDGVPRSKSRYNGVKLDSAFGIFMRHHVGVESKTITREYLFSRVTSYFEDFFPDFHARNPFEEKMEYPYKHITLGFLALVYRMPERLELLKYAEDNKLKYSEFCDYIINYIKCYNEEVEKDHYLWNFSHVYIPYVGINKYEET